MSYQLNLKFKLSSGSLSKVTRLPFDMLDFPEVFLYSQLFYVISAGLQNFTVLELFCPFDVSGSIISPRLKHGCHS